MSRRRGPLRRLARILLVVVGIVSLITAGASIWAWTASAGHIEVAGGSNGDGGDDGAARAPVAIVLGAAVHADGQPSPWLAYRLDVAADLYTSGRVEAILVSGDNRRVGYDEPTVMRGYLTSKGIPGEAIALDYAGFDTYDTCVRARRIFGIERALLVTQDFHEPRAVAICRAVGVNVEGVGDSRARRDRISWAVSWTRERLATIKAVTDVLSRREPTLGRREASVGEAIAWTREHRR
ncbi:ElyC/SanA/YdcF family protein [Actinomyces sp. ZJ308]|uniref:SanA/YdcF family protein n=1 Tax=Actinomyces sp. ZJ308 TaxID=2708342 RepID=UPI001FB94479|nr:ElyC/SanA/YdcF family protein [Actinomyces sp. ZJ308]